MFAGIALATTLAMLVLIAELLVDVAAAVVSDFWPFCPWLRCVPGENERRPVRRALQTVVAIGFGLLLATRR